MRGWGRERERKRSILPLNHSKTCQTVILMPATVFGFGNPGCIRHGLSFQGAFSVGSEISTPTILVLSGFREGYGNPDVCHLNEEATTDMT